ncbi:MAG: hypothetical protein Q7N50_13025 [Armatimonadota bacterium]|nr:hypothetical protein [Armatimonadota bacterium]
MRSIDKGAPAGLKFAKVDLRDTTGQFIAQWFFDPHQAQLKVQNRTTGADINIATINYVDINWHDWDIIYYKSTGLTEWWVDGSRVAYTMHNPGYTASRARFYSNREDDDQYIYVDELRLGGIDNNAISNLQAVGGNNQVALTWTNSTSTSYTGVMIRYKTTGYPTSVTDGTLLVDDPGSPGAADSYTHAGAVNGTTYYYTAYAHDGVPNYASGVWASATPSAPSPYLKIHPENPHYFQESATGKPVLVTGYSAIVPEISSFDDVANVNLNSSHRMMWSRGWHSGFLLLLHKAKPAKPAGALYQEDDRRDHWLLECAL